MCSKIWRSLDNTFLSLGTAPGRLSLIWVARHFEPTGCVPQAQTAEFRLKGNWIREIGHNNIGMIEPVEDLCQYNPPEWYHDKYCQFSMSGCLYGGLGYHPNRWAEILGTMQPIQSRESGRPGCDWDTCVDTIPVAGGVHKIIQYVDGDPVTVSMILLSHQEVSSDAGRWAGLLPGHGMLVSLVFGQRLASRKGSP